MSFGKRVEGALAEYGPLCPGIDPHPALLDQWGLDDDATGLTVFAERCVEAFAGQVGFVKPQSAFFERFGAAGMAVLEQTVRALRERGTLVILDVKRGDIGSTAAAYADAYLNPGRPLAADAVTVHPYLGTGSLEPFFAAADAHDSGVFVLALTSNPEGAQVQRARHDGLTVAGTVLNRLGELNAGRHPLGPYGAVVGATIGRLEEDLDIGGPLLVPGIGAQGGTAAALVDLLGPLTPRAIVPVSRSVLGGGGDVGRLRETVRQIGEELRRALARADETDSGGGAW